MYTLFNSVPTCLFLDRLVEKYPDAKFILTVRSPDSWCESMKNTILAAKTMLDSSDLPPHRVKLNELREVMVLDGVPKNEDGSYDDEELKKFFLKHIEWAKSIIPQDRLLIMELGDGWEKLCPFLGKEIPSEPYPHSNSTAEMREWHAKALAEYGDPKAAAAAILEKISKIVEPPQQQQWLVGISCCQE